ncbi:MAG: hypothetical protein ACK42L_09785, partial [Thermoanaerobaculum sp.]
MSAELAVRPLASWDAFTVRLDRDVLLVFLLRLIRRQAPQVEALNLEGEGERFSLTATVRAAGMALHLAAQIEEVRVKGGFLGFYLRTFKGPLGLGVPRFLLSMLFNRIPFPLEMDRQSGVVLVDLRGRLPMGLEVEVRHLRLHAGTIEIALGPGRLAPPAPPEAEEQEAPEAP